MDKKNKKISRREQDTLDFIKLFMLKNNVTPSVREICEGLGIKSVSAAYSHFKRLIELGYIIPHGDNTIRYSVKGIIFVESTND